MFRTRFGNLQLMKAPEQMMAHYRNGLLFAFNFHPTNSLKSVLIPVPKNADYTVEMCTDDFKYGGFGQVAHQVYPAKVFDGQAYIELYIPARTAIVLREGKENKPAPKARKAAKPAAKKETKAKA